VLDSLFYPQTIAVIGASRTRGKVGHHLIANLVNAGFSGSIVPVNPEADEILGLKCYKNLGQFGAKIDLSLIIVPRDEVKKVVLGSIDAGAKAIIIISSGFKESGQVGAELEEQIAGICKLRGVRVLGPNCLGIINTDNKMDAFYGTQMPEAGGISMIFQSSAYCSVFLDRIEDSRLGVAKVINIGNKSDLTEVDLLKALAHDPKTKIIVGYLESISSGDAFVKAAEEASIQKPVIILKGANSEAGRKAVAAHSGFQLGADSAYGAAFMRSGVVRADSFGALFDFAAAFSVQPLPVGKKVLVITNAGGPGIMAVDAIERSGLQTAYLDDENAERLAEILPKTATVFNPVDLTGNADPAHYKTALQIGMDDDGVDAILVIIVARISNNPSKIIEAIAGATHDRKPLFLSLLGGKQARTIKDQLVSHEITEFSSPEHAIAAIKAMSDYVIWKKRPPRIVTRFRVNRRRVERIIYRRQRTNRLHITEVKAKDILSAYDFKIPDGYLATSLDEAVEVADRIGYPVAMKIVSPDIVHKSDLGGVRLNITNRDAVRDSYELMMLRFAQKFPAAIVDGIYLEKMLDRGLDVILGMNRDPQFGPMLMFGLGGIFVEVLKDVAFHLAPITFNEAVQMLTSTRSYQLLVGARGEKGLDIEVIAKCLQRVSQLATDFPQIAELDINPLIIGASGSEPYVGDARITLSEVS
jgi:acetyl coenzyme A synthetase (ADP forming)-like protein